MTSPSRSSTATTISSSTTSHVYNLPASVAAGDLLLLWLAAGSSTLTPGTALANDWVEVFSTEVIAFHRWALYLRLADGTEGGTTVSATAGSAVRGGSVCDQVTGAWGSETEDVAWTISTQTATGFGTAPNPNPVTAAWGSADQLYIAAQTSGGTGATVTAPSGFSSLAQVGTAAGHIVATAELAETSSSNDPGPFALSTNENHRAVTIVIRPLSVSADGAMALTGTAAGVSALEGSASGAIALTGTAAGVPGSIGSASGAVALTGTAYGVLTMDASGAMALSGSAGAGFARVRGLFLPTVGTDAILTGGWATTLPATARLFATDPTVALDDAGRNALVAADFTEVSWTGYAAQPLTSGNWTVTGGDPTTAVHADTTWSVSADLGSPVQVVGYYVTNDADGELLWVEVFVDPPPPVESNGDEVTLAPTVTLR